MRTYIKQRTLRLKSTPTAIVALAMVSLVSVSACGGQETLQQQEVAIASSKPGPAGDGVELGSPVGGGKSTWCGGEKASWLLDVSPSTGADFAEAMVLNDAGELFVAGRQGDRKGYVAKMDPKTGCTDWVVSLDESQVNGIAADDSGNIYVVGDAETFNGIFFAKLSGETGELVWLNGATSIPDSTLDGTDGYGQGTAIAVDGQGNVFATGYYGGGIKLDSFTIRTPRKSNIWVARLDAETGGFGWVETAGGAGTDYGRGISVGKAGSIFVTGSFSETASFGSYPALQVSAGEDDIFVAKMSGDTGAFNWVTTAGGSDSETGSAIAVDASGNPYVTGSFESTSAAFGEFSKSNLSGRDAFIAKLGKDTGDFLWVRAGGGDTHQNVGNAVAVDSSGTVVVTGGTYSTTFFGGEIDNAGYSDVYVATFDGDTGDTEWVKRAGGAHNDHGNAVAIDDSSVYVAGDFIYEDFYLGTESLPTVGALDAFVAKIAK